MANFAKFLAKNPDEEWKQAGRTTKDAIEDRRTKVIEGLKATLANVDRGEDNPSRGWYKTKGDMSRVTVKSGRTIVPISGNQYNVVPRENLGAFYQAVKEAVEKGELDDAITAAFTEGDSKPKQKRKGWSAERRAAHEARMAAKKAGKA